MVERRRAGHHRVRRAHFFAGFSGGPKLVAPGLAALETTLVLHDARRIGHPDATWGITHGNPVHDDVRAIADATGVTFTFDVILNREKKITHAFGGDLLPTHRHATQVAKDIAMVGVHEPFDVVVTTNAGYPLDQNLYQSVKGMSAAAMVVRDGGAIVCAAECRDGFPDHGSYRSVFRAATSPRELLQAIEARHVTEPDQWQAQIQAKIQTKAHVAVKTDHLSPIELAEAHLDHVDNIADYVTAGSCRRGAAGTLLRPPGWPPNDPLPPSLIPSCCWSPPVIAWSVRRGWLRSSA